jgi:M3 family oligoendopeptidase
MRWTWFAKHREQFDSIFDQLVRVRHSMAEKLGYTNYIEVGYQRMHRVGYAQADVERFRAQVREHVVPLTNELRRRQSQTLGIDPLMAWDQEIYDPAGNPVPRGDADWMVERAQEMFGELGGGMDRLFSQMTSRNLIDLKSRPGKGPGGFCDVLPDFGMPFIFANSDGTMSDVTVFTHEMGHAFQCYQSLNQPLVEYIFATEDACEIHSMGLELLSWPQMKYFFGDDAERYCKLHLAKQLLFFPYGVAVDHFQHLIYANPSATAADRAAMWQEMEQIYQPSLRWGDLAHPAGGRRWQAQIHIFSYPFYYIDYTLALTCALQLWARAAEDRNGAMDAYFKLCRRGGEAAFGELVKSAGLVSPFEEGCLKRAVDRARHELAT